MDDAPETILVSTVAGGLTPLVLRRYMPGDVTKFGVQEVSDLVKEPGIMVGALAGVPSLALAMLGSDRKGPLANKPDAINTFAGFGGGAIASTLGIAMFSLREQAEAAGLALSPRGGTSAGSTGKKLKTDRTTSESASILG